MKRVLGSESRFVAHSLGLLLLALAAAGCDTAPDLFGRARDGGSTAPAVTSSTGALPDGSRTGGAATTATGASPSPTAVPIVPLPNPAGFGPLPTLWSQRVETVVSASAGLLISQGGANIFVSKDAGGTWKKASVPFKIDVRFTSDGTDLYVSGFDGLQPKFLRYGSLGAWDDASAGLPAQDVFVFAGGEGFVAAVSGKRTYLLRDGTWTLVIGSGPTGAGQTSQTALAPLAVSTEASRLFALASPTDFPASAVQVYTLDTAAMSPAWQRVGTTVSGNASGWSLGTQGGNAFVAGDGITYNLGSAAEGQAWSLDSAATSLRYARAGGRLFRTGGVGASGRIQRLAGDGTWEDFGFPNPSGGAQIALQEGILYAGGPQGLARKPIADAAAPWEPVPLSLVPARVSVIGGQDHVYAWPDFERPYELAADGAWKVLTLPDVAADQDVRLDVAGQVPVAIALSLAFQAAPTAAGFFFRDAGTWARHEGYLARGLLPAFGGVWEGRAHVVDYNGANLYLARPDSGADATWIAVTPKLPLAFPLSPAGVAIVRGKAYVLQVSSFGRGSFKVLSTALGPVIGEWTELAFPAGDHADAALLATSDDLFLATQTDNAELGADLELFKLAGRVFEPFGAHFDLLPASIVARRCNKIASDGAHIYMAGTTGAGHLALRRIPISGGTWESSGEAFGAAREITSLVVDTRARKIVVGTDIGAYVSR